MSNGFVVGTKMRLSNGKLKLIDELTLEDELLGDDSKPRKITKLEKGNGDVYEIQQNNGDTYYVTGDTILQLKVTNNW